MESSEFQQKARNIVTAYVMSRLDKTDNVVFSPDDVYVVWFSKTLQNWKALLSTTLTDGMYYEVTYDGSRQRTYLDAYKKFENVEIDDLKYAKEYRDLSEGEPAELDSMIPVVMGTGVNRQVIGEVYSWSQDERGIHVGMKLDDGQLVRGHVPIEDLVPPPGSMSFAVPPDFKITDNGEPPVASDSPGNLAHSKRLEARETNRFLRNLPDEEVMRLGLKETLGRMDVPETALVNHDTYVFGDKINPFSPRNGVFPKNTDSGVTSQEKQGL